MGPSKCSYNDMFENESCCIINIVVKIHHKTQHFDDYSSLRNGDQSNQIHKDLHWSRQSRQRLRIYDLQKL